MKLCAICIALLAAICQACAEQDVVVGENQVPQGLLIFEDGSAGDRDRPKVVLSQADGTGRRTIANFGVDPMFLPSGDRILFFIHSSRAGEKVNYDWNSHIQPPGHSVITDLNGHILKELPYRVTDISPDGWQLLVQHTPHPKEIGFVRAGDEIFVYDLKRDILTRIFGYEELAGHLDVVNLTGARWFRDGRRIAFQLRRANAYGVPSLSSLGIIRSDGTEFKEITKAPEIKPPVYLSGPLEFDISPDGSHIVYRQDLMETKGSKGVAPASQLYLMNSDGTNQHQLTSGKTWKSSPAWSPDGKQILYTDNLAPQADWYGEIVLKIMNADGSNPRRVFPAPARRILKLLPFSGYLESDDHADWWAPRSRQ